MWRADNGNAGWDLSLRRDLNDWEFDELSNILAELDQVTLNREADDELVWKPGIDGSFSVSSFYEILSGVSKIERPVFKIIWKAPIPYRVNFFVWEASLHRIHTQDRLQRWVIPMVNRCPMCKSDYE
ncbi:Reverse transcriptase zinc-binding domain [Macleaya cordata]|uniref:Reverse transcriptase zinc-binding domain n=1 Tax=Macleaya cordata TaxID=56857 RepID=A0A200PPB4_MACCD|nr:Reverse transcriptase zinc-binding domain [Macleaya cordata]